MCSHHGVPDSVTVPTSAPLMFFGHIQVHCFGECVASMHRHPRLRSCSEPVLIPATHCSVCSGVLPQKMLPRPQLAGLWIGRTRLDCLENDIAYTFALKTLLRKSQKHSSCCFRKLASHDACAERIGRRSI